MIRSLLFILWILSSFILSAQRVDSLRSYPAPAARQAVAADEDYLYAINNTTIEKYDRKSGRLLVRWQDTTGVFRHLNSGVVIGKKLYCAHSNFPEIPMAGSIEIFDTETLIPIDSHSFGIDIGSATWVDWYRGHWYVAFAHYNRFRDKTGKDNTWTQLVKFTPRWERIGGWILPADLLDRFDKMSNSGGAITPEGKLLLTGHDFKEIYEMEFPENGYALKWVRTYSTPFEGQGIALDPENSGFIFGISRFRKEIIIGQIQN